MAEKQRKVYEVRDGDRVLAQFSSEAKARDCKFDWFQKGRLVRIFTTYQTMPEKGKIEKKIDNTPLAKGKNVPPGFKGPIVPMEGILKRFAKDTRVIKVGTGKVFLLKIIPTRKGYGYYLTDPNDWVGQLIGDCYEDEIQYDGKYLGLMENHHFAAFYEVPEPVEMEGRLSLAQFRRDCSAGLWLKVIESNTPYPPVPGFIGRVAKVELHSDHVLMNGSRLDIDSASICYNGRELWKLDPDGSISLKYAVVRPPVPSMSKKKKGKKEKKTEEVGFREDWCVLEDGMILFARISDEVVEDEYQEEGYTDYVNFTLFGGVNCLDYGMYCIKDGWTVSDFAYNNWKVRAVKFVEMEDPYDLRDAIEEEDWDRVREILEDYPELAEKLEI